MDSPWKEAVISGPVAYPEPRITLALPSRMADYDDLFADLRRMADGTGKDPELGEQWLATMRCYMAGDLYFLAKVSTVGQFLDPYTGRPEIEKEFLFHFYREVQFDSDDVIDTGARGHHKSTAKTLLLTVQDTILDPNSSFGIFSFEVQAAEKHCNRIAEEVIRNPLYMRVLPEIFGEAIDEDSRVPRPRGATRWSARDGYIVPGRSLASTSPTWAAYTYRGKLPTGARLTHLIFDDIETEQTIKDADEIDDALRMFTSATRLGGRNPKRRINGTFHAPNGLLSKIVQLPGWRIRCFPVCDSKEPTPKLPSSDPLTGKPVPPEIARQDIEGAPLLLHPLEVAKIKAEHEARGALDEFYMHYWGDVRRGEARRLRREWLRFYDEKPETFAAKGIVYVCQDPSIGKGDPTFTWVWLAMPGGAYYWIDGWERKYAPSERLEQTLDTVFRWSYYTIVDHCRVEQYGPTVFADETHEFFHARGCFTRVVKIFDYSRINKFDTGKLDRIWMRWEPPCRAGNVYFPRTMRREGDRGMVDLVERFLDDEYDQFPHCERDNGLDAGGLIWVPADGKKVPRVHHPEAQTARDDIEDYPRTATWRSA